MSDKINLEDQKIPAGGKYDWPIFVVLLGIIQGGLLWMDHHPMFYFGDSESYIGTAITGWPPGDRSFVYGYFIRLVALTTQSLTMLVVVQVLMASFICFVAAHLLMRYFRVRPWIAFGAVLLIALEPLQLLYARYVMTETLALFVFVFYVWVALHYLEDSRIKWLAVLQGLAVLLISVRFAFIPLAWICAFAIPLLSVPAIYVKAGSSGVKPVFRISAHIVMSALLLFVFTTDFKHLHGYLSHKPPAYSYDDGFFALGYVMPILEPEDFPDEKLGRQILNDPAWSLADRGNRSNHRWGEDGTVARLQKLVPDRLQANAIARQAAFHAVIHRPHAFLHLGWQTFTDYFNPRCLRSAMEFDLGNRQMEEEFHQLITTHFHYSSDRSSALESKSLTGRYFLESARWLQILLFLPLGWLLLSAFTRDSDQRRKIVFTSLLVLILLGVAVFLVERPTPRYMHILAWFACLMAGVGLDRILPRRE
jgi:hypothetical protein